MTSETVKDEWGLCCPGCGKDDGLIITADVQLLLTPNGTVEHPTSGWHEWTEHSGCVCAYCDYGGNVSEFQVSDTA